MSMTDPATRADEMAAIVAFCKRHGAPDDLPLIERVAWCVRSAELGAADSAPIPDATLGTFHVALGLMKTTPERVREAETAGRWLMTFTRRGEVPA